MPSSRTDRNADFANHAHRYLAVIATCAGCAAASAQAQFTTVSLATVANARLQTTWPTFTGVPYPTGAQSWGGVPWSIPTTGNNAWFSKDATGPNPRSVVIPVNVPQVRTVYALMNTWQGNTNQSLYIDIEFTGASGATFSQRLFGGVHIRDWFQGIYTNGLTSSSTTPSVYSINAGPNGGSGTSRLDMVRFDLPVAFGTQTLTTMTIRDFGADPSGTFGQRSFIYGLTVSTLPYCYVNCDGSTAGPALNALDFSCFLDRYRQGLSLPTNLQTSSYGNCDGSTVAPVLNALDFQCFLSRYRNGCAS